MIYLRGNGIRCMTKSQRCSDRLQIVEVIASHGNEKYSLAFTLIELMIVVAIIGIWQQLLIHLTHSTKSVPIGQMYKVK